MALVTMPSLLLLPSIRSLCSRASLNYTTSSGDFGTVVRLTVLPGQPCRARYVRNSWTANFEGLSGPKTTMEFSANPLALDLVSW